MGFCKSAPTVRFRGKEIYNTLKDKMNIVVVEKSISLGRGGILASDVRWSFPRAEKKDRNISSFVAGLGGRNITKNDLAIHGGKGRKRTGGIGIFRPEKRIDI